MGVGGELNGAVYQAVSMLNQIPDTTATVSRSPDSDLCWLIYCFKLINASFVLFSLMVAFAIYLFLSRLVFPPNNQKLNQVYLWIYGI